MEDEFNKLIPVGRDNVESIIDWLKEAKFVNDNTEEAARGYLGGDGNVDFPTFKDALASIAIDTNRNVNELFMAFMKWCHCYSTCIPPPEEPSTTVKKRRMRMKPKSTKDD